MTSNADRVTHRRKWLVDLAIVAWILVALIPGGYLMASHLITLPAPAGGIENRALRHAIAARRPAADRGRWLALHVLLGSCGCSGRVIEHLIARGPRLESAEQVLLVAGDEADDDERLARSLRGRGFAVETLTAQQLFFRFGIASAPMLIVMSPDDRLVYLGGYTDRKQSAAIRDSQILDRVTEGQAQSPLPLFGCAVSKQLQKTLDPLGLKN